VVSRPEAAPVHVTPYDRLALTDAEVEHFLVTGEHQRELADFFGEEEYRELTQLARRAHSVPLRRAAPRVFILPGIMGSQLGMARRRPLPRDVLWLDPLDIAFGRLKLLRLPGRARIIALGVILYTYLRLKLRLREAGFAPEFYTYDWRLDVETLGRAFAARLRAETGPTMIVAHSMGGLVSRAALTHRGLDSVQRLVLLGTPNFGSFAPVQALRGTYAVVRKIARLDLRHSAEELAQQVFSTFPSLYQMLPAPGRSGAVDLFDARAWPRTGPRPRAELLEQARSLERLLAPADERFVAIVGVDQETVTGIERDGDDFVYTITRQGDGTVPMTCAVLPGASTHFTSVAHSDLPRDALVASAVIDLLRDGTTRRLPAEWTRGGIARTQISDRELRRTHNGKVDFAALSPDERREFLQNLNEPPQFELHVPEPRRAARRAHTIGVRRGRSRRAPGTAASRTRRARAQLEIRVEAGDIVEARAQALAVAVFQNVRPAGALAAIDARLEGLVEEFVARRMLPAEPGAIVPVPTRGRLRHAEQVLLVGIGRFDRLDAAAIEFAAENVVRLCVRAGIRSFATVLWGAGAGFPAEQSCESQLRGYLRGLVAADSNGEITHIGFRVRNASLQRHIAAVCRKVIESEQLAGRRVVVQAPEARPHARRRRVRSAVPTTAYLFVNEQPGQGSARELRAALLTAGAPAAVIAETHGISWSKLDAHFRELESPNLTLAKLGSFGERLGELTLHETVREALYAMRERPLVVVHDAASSRIPWETLCIRGWFPAAEAGLSRRYAAEQLSLAKFSEARRRGPELSVLVVADPTGDLPGAALEGERLLELLRPLADARVTLVQGRAATRARLLAEFQSGEYDLLHFAGHAFFDASAPERSGVRCSDAVLSGADLAGLARLPALVVFNACESGRLRRGAATVRVRAGIARRLRESHGLAEVFLRGGVANYIGTYWPVGDSAALAFAESFYPALLRNASIGAAVVEARSAIRAKRSPDWADYVHYGDPEFRLKEGHL